MSAQFPTEADRKRGKPGPRAKQIEFTLNTDGCWIVTNHGTNEGYPVKTINKKQHSIVRLVYEISIDKIPNGLWTLHKCDNRLCINPDHIFLGTPFDNVRDMDSKKRRVSPRNESHWNSKLTVSDVLKIRSDKRQTSQISKEYGICQASVREIKRKETWGNV